MIALANPRTTTNAAISSSPTWNCSDPASGVTGAIYSQTLPFADPPAFQVYADFEQALYASL